MMDVCENSSEYSFHMKAGNFPCTLTNDVLLKLTS
jgi:hypothetical protein